MTKDRDNGAADAKVEADFMRGYSAFWNGLGSWACTGSVDELRGWNSAMTECRDSEDE